MILMVKSNNVIKLLDLEKAETIEVTKQESYCLNIIFQNWRFTKRIDIKDEHVEVLAQYFAVMKNKTAIEDLEKLLEKLNGDLNG